MTGARRVVCTPDGELTQARDCLDDLRRNTEDLDENGADIASALSDMRELTRSVSKLSEALSSTVERGRIVTKEAIN